MRPILSIILSFLLLFGESSALLFAAPSSLEERVAEKVKQTPAQIYQRLEDQINLFLAEDDEESAASSAPEKALSPEEERAYQQQIAQLVKGIYEDWKALSSTKYKKDADRLWLTFSVVLLQQDDWLSFFGGEQNFRKNWFPSLAQFYANVVNQNIVMMSDASGNADDLQQRVYFSGLALQNLVAFQAQGYALKKSYWEQLAPKAILSLQSGLIVDLVFPILVKNGSWKALDKALEGATRQEWDGRSSAFMAGLGTVLQGAGIIGIPSLIKQKIDNFDGSRDLVFGSVSRLGEVGWKLSSTHYEPATTTAWYEIHLDGNYRRKAADFVVKTESHVVAGLGNIVCPSQADHVSVSGSKIYVFEVRSLQELTDKLKSVDEDFSTNDGIPLSQSKYAKYDREIAEMIDRRQGTATNTKLPEVVVLGQRGKKDSTASVDAKGPVVPSADFSTSWMEFATLLEQKNPKLLAKYTANLFDNNGKPASSQVMWPLVLGYLLQPNRDNRAVSKPFKMAQYFARKTWGDIDVSTEQNLDSRLTARYPQLACYAARGTKEEDSFRQYIMITPERVRGGINARWGGQVVNDMKPLADAIDWTLVVVAAPTILKTGWRFSLNSGRLLVGRPAVLKGGRLVNRAQLLRLSRARLNRIVRQTSAKVQGSVKKLRNVAANTAAQVSKAATGKKPGAPVAASGGKQAAAAAKKGAAAPVETVNPVVPDVPAAAPVPEAVSSVPQAQIRTALEGPLDQLVMKPVRMGDRSLMPRTKAKVERGWMRESDLVYMEQHATDPNKVVMYYTDEAGSRVTAREVTRAEYDQIVGAMSDADKAGLNQSAKLLEKEISKVRLDREYDRLEVMGKRVRSLREERMRIETTGTGSQRELARVREIDQEIKALETEANATVTEISSMQNIKPESVRTVYNSAKEVNVPTVKNAPKPAPMAQRSLMPRTRAKVEPGWTRESDLVYMEQHATDPNKVVMYYTDGAGRRVTAREVTRAEYEQIVGAMSDADKAGLNQSAKLFEKEITSARLEREYDRLETLGKRVRDLKQQLAEVDSSDVVFVFGEGNRVERGTRIQKEIAVLEAEAEGVVQDIARASKTRPESVRTVFNVSKESAPVAKAAGPKPYYSLKERNLFADYVPRGKTNVEPRADGIIAMERHATDPSKTIVYMQDEFGNVRMSQWYTSEADKFVASLSEAEKGQLAALGQENAKALQSLRMEQAYNDLESVGKRLKEMRTQQQYLAKKNAPFQEQNALAKQIRELEDVAKQMGNDMVRSGYGSSYSVGLFLENAQTSFVQSAKKAANPLMRERSLMPGTKAQVGPGWTRESDLVYIEQHATDPNKAVMYYTDKGGHSVAAREVARAEYEQVVGAMSEADKAGLNKSASLFKKEISKVRLEREYDRLYKLGEELENAANRLDQIKKGASFEKEGVVLNSRAQALQTEIAGVINDIAQEAKTSPRTLWQMLGYRYPQVSRWAK